MNQDFEDVVARPALRDDVLVRGFHEPGSRSFEVIYRRHARAVHAYAATVLNLVADVEEVVQDTFVLAWRKLDADRMAGGSALPWLLATAKYLSYNTNRARARLSLLERSQSEAFVAEKAADDRVLALEVAGEIATALARLSAVDRKIVDLCLVQDLSYKEAAHRLGLSNGSIRNRLSRAREALRGELRLLKGENL